MSLLRKRPYRTARAVLKHDNHFLLAVHSSFWARRERRWGLPGGRIEWGESPHQAVRRELREELDLQLNNMTEIGAFRYKGADHMVYGAHTDQRVTRYDKAELLDLRWFNLQELAELEQRRLLHAGYELQAIRRYLNSSP